MIGVHEGADTEAGSGPSASAGNHDPLTGLPNRMVLQDRLGQALGRLRRRGGTVGVLFLDVDGFKHINDRYGHDAGDGFLREVPSRLRSALRCRRHRRPPERRRVRDPAGGLRRRRRCASGWRERVLEAFETPFTLGDETLALRVSVGIAVTEAHDDRAEDLLTHADVAMYRAKQSGGDGLAMFDSTLRAARQRARRPGARPARRARHRPALEPFYQPVVDLSQRVTGPRRWCAGSTRRGRAAREFIESPRRPA